MPHLTSAQERVLDSATGSKFSSHPIATELHQESRSLASQERDGFDLSVMSLGGKCNNLQERHVTFLADEACYEATESCESTVAKACAGGFPELSKEEKLTTPAKFGNFFFHQDLGTMRNC